SSPLHCPRPPRYPHSFPTRRSSDLLPDEPATSVMLYAVFADRVIVSFPVQDSSVKPVLELLFCGWKRSDVAAAPLGHDLTILSRSEEHTSELQSRGHLVCRLLLEKK